MNEYDSDASQRPLEDDDVGSIDEPEPGTLLGALKHMPENPTQEKITGHIKAFCAMSTDKKAQVFSKMNDELRMNGNSKGHGPMMLLGVVRATNHCELFYGISKVPQGELPANSRSQCKGDDKYVVFCGDRDDPSTLSPYTGAFTPEALFGPRMAKLANYNGATNAAPGEDDEALDHYVNAPDVEVVPLVPLHGRSICEKVHQGLCGPTPWGTRQTPARVILISKPNMR